MYPLQPPRVLDELAVPGTNGIVVNEPHPIPLRRSVGGAADLRAVDRLSPIDYLTIRRLPLGPELGDDFGNGPSDHIGDLAAIDFRQPFVDRDKTELRVQQSQPGGQGRIKRLDFAELPRNRPVPSSNAASLRRS